MKLQYFPYKPREHQAELINYIQKTLKKVPSVCINASTGFGKTPVILAALLPYVKKFQSKIVWAVRTGTETDRPIEELKVINEYLNERNENIFGFSYRGKKDMCLLALDLKLTRTDWTDIAFLCKHRINECRYARNFENFYADERFFENPLLYSEILKLCMDLKVCPYKVQNILLEYADVVSLNYNYIVNEKIRWAIQNKIDFSKSFLIVDEAHNLQNIGGMLTSDTISIRSVKSAQRELEYFEGDDDYDISHEFLEVLKNNMQDLYDDLKMKRIEDIEFQPTSFFKKSLKSFSKVLEACKAMAAFGISIRRRLLDSNKSPRSSLYHISDFWLNAFECTATNGIAFIASCDKKSKHLKNLHLEIYDMRASAVLSKIWRKFFRTVFCSGTIEPIDAFADTVGLKMFEGKSVPSIFKSSNIRALILTDVSTEGEVLKKNMCLKYLDAIEKLILHTDVNTAIFCASYRIQSSLFKAGLKDMLESLNRNVFVEKEGMSGGESRKILDDFKKCYKSKRKGVLCATMTGRYAEGADFPGKELEAIFLVGIPFDRLNTRTHLYMEYYKNLYGDEKGVFYSYIIPALKRASQSLGRALRSKNESAILICGDRRYTRFLKLLPDYFRTNVKPTDTNSMAKLVENFF
jgi:DNA excision repair protein ERCC-2